MLMTSSYPRVAATAWGVLCIRCFNCTWFYVLAGRTGAGCPTVFTTFFNDLSSVSCRTPEPACFPDAASVSSNYNLTSGWTADGRALHALRTALGLTPNMLAHPAPCVLKCDNQQQGNNNGTGPGNNTGGPSTSPPPPPQLCYPCEETSQQVYRLDEMSTSVPYMVSRELWVSGLNFNNMVWAGAVPPDKLRLVPEMFAFPRLSMLKASGFPLSGKHPQVRQQYRLCSTKRNSGLHAKAMRTNTVTALHGIDALHGC